MGDEATPGSLPAYTPGDLLRAVRPLHLLRGAVAAEEPDDAVEVYSVAARERSGWKLDAVVGEKATACWVAEEDMGRLFEPMSEADYAALFAETEEDRRLEAEWHAMRQAAHAAREPGIGQYATLDYLVFESVPELPGETQEEQAARPYVPDVYQIEEQDAEGYDLRLASGRGPERLRLCKGDLSLDVRHIPKADDARIYEYEQDCWLVQERMAALAEADLEAMKHEVWACKVGDLLEVIATIEFADRRPEDDDDTPFWAEMRPDGQIYRVADLKGRGFDLVLVSGEGPLEIRAMNSEVPGKFRVLPQP